MEVDEEEQGFFASLASFFSYGCCEDRRQESPELDAEKPVHEHQQRPVERQSAATVMNAAEQRVLDEEKAFQLDMTGFFVCCDYEERRSKELEADARASSAPITIDEIGVYSGAPVPQMEGLSLDDEDLMAQLDQLEGIQDLRDRNPLDGTLGQTGQGGIYVGADTQRMSDEFAAGNMRQVLGDSSEIQEDLVSLVSDGHAWFQDQELEQPVHTSSMQVDPQPTRSDPTVLNQARQNPLSDVQPAHTSWPADELSRQQQQQTHEAQDLAHLHMYAGPPQPTFAPPQAGNVNANLAPQQQQQAHKWFQSQKPVEYRVLGHQAQSIHAIQPLGYDHANDSAFAGHLSTGLSASSVTSSSVGITFNVTGQNGQSSNKRAKANKIRAVEMTYKCGYCGSIKKSSSQCADGRVRIRCECGGQHQDQRSRMHATWIPVPDSSTLAPNAELTVPLETMPTMKATSTQAQQPLPSTCEYRIHQPVVATQKPQAQLDLQFVDESNNFPHKPDKADKP